MMEDNWGKRIMTEEEFTRAVLDSYKDGIKEGFRKGMIASAVEREQTARVSYLRRQSADEVYNKYWALTAFV